MAQSPYLSQPSVWSRLADLLALERRDLQIVVSYGLGVGVLSLATPVAVQALIGVVAFGALVQPIIVLSALLALVLAFSAALKAAQSFVVEMISRRIFLRAAARTAERAARTERTGNLVKLTNRFFDVVTIEKASAVLLFDGVAVVLQVIAGMILLAVYHPVLLAFDVLVAVLVAILVIVPGKSALRTALEESSAKFAMADWLEELALHPGLFDSARGATFADARTKARLDDWLSARTRHFRRVFLQTVGFLGLQAVVMTALLGLGGWLVIQRELAVGQLVAAELVMAATVASVARLGKLLQKAYDLLAALGKLGSVTDIEPVPARPDRLPADQRGLPLRVRADDIALDIAAGEKVRLIGAEGSGKSRLLEAVARLADPSYVVELDGLDSRTLNRRDTRDVLCLLGEGGIVEASVEDNLRVACPDASARNIADALARTGLTDVVAGLPAGLDTGLASDGAPLSGTQAKRLLVARALLAQPRLLLIDRFFDDLADDSLARIGDALLGDNAPWTVVCVTDDPRVPPLLGREVALLNGAIMNAEELR